ncbi:MAG: class I SAM-dependent methyltransferase [Oscillospiraceae bacterium]|nr:class I SAM-dependent methyltransferase [Oscillospiraceae bacterium]
MDALKELQEKWTLQNYESEVQQRIWDRRAESFSAHPLPAWDKDLFLQRMAEEVPLDCSSRTLDVGCGAGGYSIRLAERVGEAVGVDVSPNMIAAAEARAAELGVTNCRFSAFDWAAADIDALGFRGAFDVAFAHMTPAICDFATLDKLNACSGNLVMLEKPTRRTNQIQDACFAAVGLPGEKSLDTDLINIFTYAWCKGYEPKLFYITENWDMPQNAEEFTAWCTDRARLKKPLTEADEAAIRDLIASHTDENGKVQEHTVTTRVTVLWHVKK